MTAGEAGMAGEHKFFITTKNTENAKLSLRVSEASVAISGLEIATSACGLLAMTLYGVFL